MPLYYRILAIALALLFVAWLVYVYRGGPGMENAAG